MGKAASHTIFSHINTTALPIQLHRQQVTQYSVIPTLQHYPYSCTGSKSHNIQSYRHYSITHTVAQAVSHTIFSHTNITALPIQLHRQQVTQYSVIPTLQCLYWDINSRLCAS